MFFPRVFFVSNLRVLLLPCIFTRARQTRVSRRRPSPRRRRSAVGRHGTRPRIHGKTRMSRILPGRDTDDAIDGIIGVLPSLGEVPGELYMLICAEVVLFFPRVFFVSNLRVLLLPCICARAQTRRKPSSSSFLVRGKQHYFPAGYRAL